MKAFVLESPAKALIKEIEEPQIIDAYQAKLSPIAISMCTSDVNTVYGTGSKKPDNLVLGHEAIARVVEVGEKVKDFKIGDIVVVPSMTPDWRHPQVQEGNILHAGKNFSANALSRSINGVFAEYFIVEDADMNLAILPDEVNIEDALMCVDMVTTGFTGAEEADIQTGDTVAVFGIGAVGLMAILGARLHGAGRIIAIGTRQICKDLAYKYGASEVYSYKEMDIVEKIMSETKGVGADVAIICGGNDKTLDEAMRILRYGVGRAVNLKLFSGDGDMSFSKFYNGRGMSGKSLKMELGKGGRVRMERLLNMIKYKRFSAKELITHKFYGFENVYKCLELMKEKGDGLIKTMLIPEWK